MALMYGSIQAGETMDNKVVEAGLVSDTIFLPGITFNPNTIEKNGVRYAVKDVDETIVAPSAAGANNYSFSNADEALVQIVCNNELTISTRVYGTQIAGVPYDQKVYQFENLIKGKLNPSIEAETLACLLYEGTVLTSGSPAATDTTAITTANVKDYFINLRTKLRKAKVKAQGLVALVSPEVYGTILKVAGADFDSSIKNEIAFSGNIGRWLGFLIVEANLIGETALKYVDYSGTLRTVDSSEVDMVVYNFETLYRDTLISKVAMQDATSFNGVEVVSDIVNGVRVGTASKVFIKKNA